MLKMVDVVWLVEMFVLGVWVVFGGVVNKAKRALENVEGVIENVASDLKMFVMNVMKKM